MDEQRSNKGQKCTWEGRRVAKSGGVATHPLQRNIMSSEAKVVTKPKATLKHEQ